MISAKWFPQRLTFDLENSDDKYENALEDDTVISRFLVWLLCLEILDNASKTDISNRSHLSSYIETTNAVSAIMELVLVSATYVQDEVNPVIYTYKLLI